MNGLVKGNIEKLTIKNKNYRKVISTTRQSQLVLMNLISGQDIGMEAHPHTTQFIRVEKGTGTAVIDNKIFHLKEGDFIIVPSGSYHNITAGRLGLKLYTIYSPPEHRPGTVEKTKIR
jgi:mannose-6-phosphate isomerase-like protein (cupin superfamily)